VKAVKQWVFVASEKEESIEISVGFDPNSTGSKTRNLTQRSQRRRVRREEKIRNGPSD